MEVTVFVKIRAIPAGFAIKVDLADDAVLGERFEAIVHRGQGNLGKLVFDVEKDILRRRVNALRHQRAIHFPALARHAQAVDFLRKILLFVRVVGVANHGGREKLAQHFYKSRMILIFILN